MRANTTADYRPLLSWDRMFATTALLAGLVILVRSVDVKNLKAGPLRAGVRAGVATMRATRDRQMFRPTVGV